MSRFAAFQARFDAISCLNDSISQFAQFVPNQ